MSHSNRKNVPPLAPSNISLTGRPGSHATSERTGHLSISELSGGPSSSESRKPPDTSSPQPTSTGARSDIILEKDSSSLSLSDVLKEREAMLHANHPATLGRDITYTRTGRISKAKKGLKVHHCKCGRSYTRAEHLRRHQKNHDDEPLRCNFPDCGKTFHRADLLQRHQERHQEGRRDGPPRPDHLIGPSPSHSSHTLQGSQTLTNFIPSVSGMLPNSMYPITTSAHTDAFSDIGHGKTRSFTTSHSFVRSAAPLSSEVSVPFSYGWCPSPEDSGTSGHASPEYHAAIMPMGPFPHDHDNYRHRSLSTTPAVEPWLSYGPQAPHSPLSDTSSLHQSWADAEYSQGMLGMPMGIAASSYDYPVVTSSTSAKSFPGYVIYPTMPTKTAEQRDEEERRILFPEGQAYDLEHDPFQSNLYMDSYWRHFHPIFPIVHKSTVAQQEPIPLLKAAMMAVGAQYAKQANGRADSRDLHERCLKLLPQRAMDLSIPQRSSDMQALFLIEFLSLFRGRRGKHQLSTGFKDVFSSLEHDTQNKYAPATLDGLPHQDSRSRYDKWQEWIEISTKQRLLAACYVLDSQQATLLARKLPNNAAVLDLLMPAAIALWDAESAGAWASACHAMSPQIFVYDALEMSHPFRASDPFQSALLIAAHYAQARDSPETVRLPHIIDSATSTQILYLSYQICRAIPLRDLLAVSGESWILGEKVPSKEAFASHRNTLRSWINTIWVAPEGTHISDAMNLAAQLLELSLSTLPEASLIPGSEMGIYFAALLMWAVAQAATSRWRQSTGIAASPHAINPIEPSGMRIEDMDRAISEFLYTFKSGSVLPNLLSIGQQAQPQQPFALTQWQRGVDALLRRTKLRMSGQSSNTGASLGELLDGAVNVLSKLVRKGWTEEAL